MISKKVYFNSLDGLRSVACILVIIAHSFSVYRDNNINSQDYLSVITRTILDLGGEGVSIFFVLSGFLITFLLIKEYKNNNQINFFHFYMRRTLRIWPLFYAVVIYALFIYPFIASILGLNHEQNGSVLMNLIFLNNFDLIQLVENGQEGFNQHLQITWSVAIEEQFYLLWPIIFLIIVKTKRYFLIFSMLFILIFSFKYNSNSIVNYFHSVAAAGDLMIGCSSAFLITQSKKLLFFFNSQKKNVRLIIYLIGISLIINKSFFYEYLPVIFILRCFYAYVILDQSFNVNNHLKLENLVSITKIGKYTYSMYLLHPIPLLFSKHILDYADLSYKENLAVSTVLFTATMSLTIFMSYLSYNYFESYFLKIKRKFITN